MLRAGACMLDITPKAGTQLGGTAFGEYRPAQIVLDPLYVRALVLEGNARSSCIVALDVIIITKPACDRIRRAAQELCGIPYENVLVHATQTHSAPGVGGFMFDEDLPVTFTPETEYMNGTSTQYTEYAIERAIEAIRQAAASMRPVWMGLGSGIADKLAFNRRMITRSGAMVMPGLWRQAHQPEGPTDYLYYEGPTDPEASVLCLRDEHMNMVAMVMHFTSHPVNVFDTTRSWHSVSADWPGAWSDCARAQYGTDCVPIVLNGCCGNINPWDPFTPDFMPDHKRMGGALWQVTQKVIQRMSFDNAAEVDVRTRILPLGYREVPRSRLDAVEKILGKDLQPNFAGGDTNRVNDKWFLAASTRSIEYCKRRMPEFLYEIHAIRVGDAVIVGLPGEPFVEGQLAIKTASPAKRALVAHCVSQYVGYIAIEQGFAYNAHETSYLYPFWAKLEPKALDKIVECARAMVAELF